MREIFRKFSDIQVRKQVKQWKTAIHESIHHQFIIHLGCIQTSGPLTIMTFPLLSCSLILLGDIVDISCHVSWHFYITNCWKISAEFLRESAVIFPEIPRKIPQEISRNFPTYNPSYLTIGLMDLIFYGILPEKCRYFSGNFQKNSAGNFPTYNPSYRTIGLMDYWSANGLVD